MPTKATTIVRFLWVWTVVAAAAASFMRAPMLGWVIAAGAAGALFCEVLLRKRPTIASGCAIAITVIMIVLAYYVLYHGPDPRLG